MTTLGPGMIVAGFIFFVISNVGFESANVFYNAYLPDIVPPERLGRTSGHGYSLGYLGSALGLILVLPFAQAGRVEYVWLTDIAFFAVGSPAEVSVDAYPDRSFEGRIAYIAPSATRPGRNFQAEVEVANADGTLRSGLIVRTRLQRRMFENAVVVPRDVLVERDGILHAFVLEDGTAGLRSITLGPDEGDRVVITSGLEVGETLITEGHRNLLDGQPVRVVSQRD